MASQPFAAAMSRSARAAFENVGRRPTRRGFRPSPPRAFGSSSGNNSNGNNGDDGRTPAHQMRIAVVGGGAAGMTSALHLAPLVASGLVRGPVDVYESSDVAKTKRCRGKNHGRQSHPGSGALGRDIGVGIWSTAWWPFLRSVGDGLSCEDVGSDGGGDKNENTSLENIVRRQKNRKSYQILLQDLEACGSYVKEVGYRTPDGGWLVKSELNASPLGIVDLLGNGSGESIDSSVSIDPRSLENEDPSLLFVREKDLLSCLRNAIRIEQRLGTVRYHSGVAVDGIENVSGDLGSLVLRPTADSPDGAEDAPLVSPQYHLIIAADGLYSTSRSRFAGHHSIHALRTGIESSAESSPRTKPRDTLEYRWEHTKGQREATEIEDREYIVFRGNAPKLESSEEDGSGSFQTWGAERSMRFAAVPFRHETEDLEDDDGDVVDSSHYSQTQSFISKKKEEEVWFATISDPALVDACRGSADPDANELKGLLLEAFGSWHRPVRTLIESTPAERIMYEPAVAHRYNAPPVFDVARILEFETWQKRRRAEEEGVAPGAVGDGRIGGRGPILAFVGDSHMTVDPVLAQGFTMAMEAGGSIAGSVERTLVRPGAAPSSCPMYDPRRLRGELVARHHDRERRLLRLLRSTELVQLLAQPRGLGAALATWIVRPVVKLCPEGVKRRVFDFMIRYSLGLTGGGRVGGINDT